MNKTVAPTKMFVLVLGAWEGMRMYVQVHNGQRETSSVSLSL